MTGNLQAIGFLFTWVLLWCLGGIGLESLLLQAGLIAPGGGSLAGGLGFLVWTLLIGFAGWALFNRITGLTQPAPAVEACFGRVSSIGDPATSPALGAQSIG